MCCILQLWSLGMKVCPNCQARHEDEVLDCDCGFRMPLSDSNKSSFSTLNKFLIGLFFGIFVCGLYLIRTIIYLYSPIVILTTLCFASASFFHFSTRCFKTSNNQSFLIVFLAFFIAALSGGIFVIWYYFIFLIIVGTFILIFCRIFMKKDSDQVPIETIAILLSCQLPTRLLQDAVDDLMQNNIAAGYVFGFHDCFLQRLGLYDVTNPSQFFSIFELSYRNIFGNEAGFNLFRASVNSQDNVDFIAGRMSGGRDVDAFLNNKTAPMGLGRILVLGIKPN